MRYRFALAVVAACCALFTAPAAAEPAAISLQEAIRKYNAEAAADTVGKEQPPLTEEEVLAAIRFAVRADESQATDELFKQFKQVAETRQVPPGAEFEVLNSIDRGGDFIFHGWWLRLMLKKPDGGTYSFTIRDRLLRTVSIEQAAADLEKALARTPPLPGRYRLEDRLKELKARISRSQRVKPE